MLDVKRCFLLVATLVVGIANPMAAQFNVKSNGAPAGAAAQPKLPAITVDANVVNTPNVNVVNTPNINVANVPTVNLANGTAVAVVGTPTVQVSNTAANPIFVTSTAAQPRQPIRLQQRLRVNLPSPTADTYTDFVGFVVPAGKQLVVEYINAFIPSGSTDTLAGQFLLIPTTNPSPGLVTLEDEYAFPGQGGYLTGNQTLIFVDAGKGLRFVAELPSNVYSGGTVDLLVTVSGYLVDVP
jgi:hypothetical protein